MIRYKLVLLSENAAFSENPLGELYRILSEEAERIRNAGDVKYFTSPVLDVNGNVVGNVTFSLK